MVDEKNVSLFKNNSESIKMPSVTDSNYSKPSIDIESVLKEDKIRTLIVPEDTEILSKNFIIDLTNIVKISAMQLKALSAMKCKDGDTAIYIYKKNVGLTLLGFGYEYDLDMNLPLVKNYLFDKSEIKVYKDFKVGAEAKEVLTVDITHIRLNL